LALRFVRCSYVRAALFSSSMSSRSIIAVRLPSRSRDRGVTACTGPRNDLSPLGTIIPFLHLDRCDTSVSLLIGMGMTVPLSVALARGFFLAPATTQTKTAGICAGGREPISRDLAMLPANASESKRRPRASVGNATTLCCSVSDYRHKKESPAAYQMVRGSRRVPGGRGNGVAPSLIARTPASTFLFLKKC
jgi:hypothetical protein